MTATTSRRAVLAGLAGFAASPALTMPALATPKEIDPIFAAIEKHRRLCAESEAICLECEKARDLIPDEWRDNPLVTTFPARDPGKVVLIEKTDDYEIIRHEKGGFTGAMHYATSMKELRREATTLPEEHRAAWLADRSAALKREQRRVNKIRKDSGYGALDKRRSALDHAEYDAGQELIATRPTTLEGIAALAIYVAECPSREYSLMPAGEGQTEVLENLGAACRDLMPSLKVDVGCERAGRRGA